MIKMTDQQLQDFQEAVAWQTGLRLPDGRVLGVEGKRGKLSEGLDQRVRVVLERLEPQQKTILEFGSLEGILTTQLAGVCKQVVGLEIRPRNVIGALVRLFVHGVSNARLRLQDVRDLGDELGRFDIAFHVGVLYHLPDPVSHLARVAEISTDLLLDTHYAADHLPLPEAELAWGSQTYRGKVWPEAGWNNAFAGVEPTAVWLYQQDLVRLLRDLGYDSVEVLDDRQERNGPRLTLLARQPRGVGYASATTFIRQQFGAWEEAARARKQLAEIRSQHEALSQELEQMRSSWAWRLGRLAVGPLRPVRRLFARK